MYNIDHKDYTFVESNNVDFYGVQLNDSKYKGVILVYGKGGIKESPELDIATLSFTYQVTDPGEHDHDELVKDEYFNNYIGAVLQHIIEENMNDDKLTEDIIGHNKSNTDSHSESSSQ